MDKKKVAAAYIKKFGAYPQVFVKSPGRINIIGEHTDYNLGWVLPAAIDKSIWFAASKRDDDIINIYSINLSSFFSISIPEIKRLNTSRWANYLLGILHELQLQNHSISGLNVVFGSNIPSGAGLSSSAAIECGFLFVLNALFHLQLSNKDIILLAQKSENDFVGMNCGVMDMFAIVAGKSQQAIQLDCRDLSFSYLPFTTSAYQFLLFNTGVKHSLVNSEYNTRRSQCEEGVSIIQRKNKHIQSLRDVDINMLNDAKSAMDSIVYQRCKYVIEENERLHLACAALQQHDFSTLGNLMFQTHEGLSKAYQVSCEELDFLVAHVKNTDGVLGARMMGGGFGGCTINLIERDKKAIICDTMSYLYEKHFSIPLTIYEVNIGDGVVYI